MRRNALISVPQIAPEGYDQPGGPERFREAHALKERIEKYLDLNVKRQIDSLRAAKKTFEEEQYAIWLDHDLGEQRFPRMKTATIVRKWIWDTYRGRVGLEVYDVNRIGRWRICIVY